MRIWINHWFSTAYYFVEMLKDYGYEVIGSNEKDTCVYKTNVDEFYLEPKYNENTYIDYCLNFCINHKINVFFVKRGMNLVVDNLKKFQDINVKVICEQDREKFFVLQDKFATMNYFKEKDYINIPEMRIVTNVKEFVDAYNYLHAKYNFVCIKYNQDEGGMSYKLISDRKPSLNRISENNGLVYSLSYVIECLSSVETFKPLIVMPYLEGTEISIDCLGLNNELLAIPRYKLSNRVTKIDMDDNLIKLANKVYNDLKLDGPFNIQFRYSKNKLYLLEINTRLSGGSWKEKYIGCEFPVLCVKKFTNELKELPKINFKTMELSNLEYIVKLNEINYSCVQKEIAKDSEY